jgi:hypothetical protein
MRPARWLMVSCEKPSSVILSEAATPLRMTALKHESRRKIRRPTPDANARN